MKFATLCVIQIYGIFFILLGGCCVIGHILRIPWLSTFGADSDMAPPTGIGFLSIGTSYFILAKPIHRKCDKT